MADQTVTVPAHALPHRAPTQFLNLARRGLAEAADTRSDGLRYAAAHLAALRAAGAIIAARATPTRDRSHRTQGVWVLLAQVAPELGEWANYFADGATKRAAAEAGIPHAVTAQEADNLIRAAEHFVSVVETQIGANRV